MSVSIYVKADEPDTVPGDLMSELTPDGRDHLIWCTEKEFDVTLGQLSERGLLELIQLLQDAMLIEQQTFDSLQLQLEAPSAPSASAVQRRRLSAALCSSQGRLTRLCARSMRCFTQQAFRSRQRESAALGQPDVTTDQRRASAFRRNLANLQKAALSLNSRFGQPPAVPPPPPPLHYGEQERRSPSSSDRAPADDRLESLLFVAGRQRLVTSPGAGVTLAAADTVGPGLAAAGRRQRRPSADGGAAAGSARGRVGGGAAGRLREASRERSGRPWSVGVAELHQPASAPGDDSLVPDGRWRRGQQASEPPAPPRRRPRVHFGPAEQRRSHEDLSTFGWPAAARLDASGGLTRASSCGDGLNLPSEDGPERRALSFCPVLAGGAERAAGRLGLRRVPSVDEILDSVKDLRTRRHRGEMGGEPEPPPPPQSSMADYQNVPVGGGGGRSPWTGATFRGPTRLGRADQTTEPASGCYENVVVGPAGQPSRRRSSEVIYDQPVVSGRRRESAVLYENVHFSGPSAQPAYMNVAETGGGRPPGPVVYDVPRAVQQYDTPRGRQDAPPPGRATTARHAALAQPAEPEPDSDWDCDSLEGEPADWPSTPTPDYDVCSEGAGGPAGGPTADDQLDEGLGESDSRSPYNDDLCLGVILEEPEEEYVTTSEEDEPSAPRSPGSVVDSEGIGSAEGDLGSNDSEEPGGGVHSPGGPGAPGQGDDDEGVQKDRCVEIYPETMRQRRQHNKHKQAEETCQGNISKEILVKDSRSASARKNLLPSVKVLKTQFENSSHSSTSASGRHHRYGSLDKSQANLDAQLAPSDEGTTRKDVATSGRASSQKCQTAPGDGRTVKKNYTCDDQLGTLLDKFSQVNEKQWKSRINTAPWDPSALVNVLYEVPKPSRRSRLGCKGYINIEGWLEKLPSGRKKATFWNMWKRRYFKAKDGFLYYYQSNTTEKPSLVLQLMGGNVRVMDCSMMEDRSERASETGPILSLDDGKGRQMVVRCDSGDEADRWTKALLSHTAEDYSATYVHPAFVPAPLGPARRCLVIDLGGLSVRAGVLMGQPSLPQLFFPAAVVTSPDGRQLACGAAALRPAARAAGRLWFPLRSAPLDVAAAAALLRLAFRELRLSPADCAVQLSVPRRLGPAASAALLRLMFDEFGARAVNVTHQSVLALSAYNAVSGVVVDVGDRMDVVPVVEGSVEEGGVTRLPCGGAQLLDHLRLCLLQRGYPLSGAAESLLLQHALEQLCFVSERYELEMRRWRADPSGLLRVLSLSELPTDSVPWRQLDLDCGRFQVPEGLFHPELWDLHHKGVHKLVYMAVQACSVDRRREMVRSVYLSGGVTLLPGFAERLQRELSRLTPDSVTPRVHASPYRYHAAYLGACVLAGSDAFQKRAVSLDSWRSMGPAALSRWPL